MSASRVSSSSSRSSSSRRTSSSVRDRGRARKAAPPIAATRPPWVRNGIDYGPATAAARDLAVWAFDLAERDVADWPLGQKRVHNTRRYVLAQLEGRRAPRVSVADLMFTATLIARILDADLQLGLADMLDVLEALELPTEDILPLEASRRRPTALGPSARILRLPSPAPASSATVGFAPPPLRFCESCGLVHEVGDHIHPGAFGNAA